MTEQLLQYIWQFQHFNKENLNIETGQKLEIIYPGRLNLNQGPDFSNARIRIGQTLWAGDIEIHIKTLLWNTHGHQFDPNYKKVILHVVWEDNSRGNSPGNIPVFCLRSRMSATLLKNCEEWMKNHSFLICGDQFGQINRSIWVIWKKRLLMERLHRKSLMIFQFLKENKNNWETTFWWLLARNFGAKDNMDPFESIAKSVPLKVLAKHKQNLVELEALLIGQAGLLGDSFSDAYPRQLKTIYRQLKLVYKLREVYEPVYFLHMRPASLPHIRLAQLAALIHVSSGLFLKVREARSLPEVKKLLWVTPGEYWNNHYTFSGESSNKKPKRIGDTMITNIIANTFAPLLYTYSQSTGDRKYLEKALHWLEELNPEQNVITIAFMQAGGINNNASDSHALIELKTMYCDQKRCENCAIKKAMPVKASP